MRHVLRSALGLALGLLGLICGACGHGETPALPPVRAAAAPASAPTPADPRCPALCARAAECLDARGVPRSDEENDCGRSCADGAYRAMPASMLECLDAAGCEGFVDCTGRALAQQLDPAAPPAEARAQAGAPTPPVAGRPADPWPEAFPEIPGGTPISPDAPNPAVQVAVRAYDTSLDALETLLRIELGAQGWEAHATEEADGARRFLAVRTGREVQVALYREGDRARMQVMELRP